MPRQDAPGPLVPRHVPANVAVAVLPLQNDAKSVGEKVEVGLAQNPNFRELRDLTARMLGYYREQDWTQALATIELCRKASASARSSICTPNASRLSGVIRRRRTGTASTRPRVSSVHKVRRLRARRGSRNANCEG